MKKCKHCGQNIVEKRRSNAQNRALHLWFTQLAEELNNAGYDMKKLIRKEIDIPWSARNVKEYIWRPVQKAYLGVESSKDLKTQDIDKLFDIINRVLAERTGIYLPFPNINYFMQEGRE